MKKCLRAVHERAHQREIISDDKSAGDRAQLFRGSFKEQMEVLEQFGLFGE